MNATADKLTAGLPAMEYETKRLFEGVLTAELTGGKSLIMARRKWKSAKVKMENRISEIAYHRNVAADLAHYMKYVSWRPFKNRPLMVDLPVFRLPVDGRAKGIDPMGKSTVLCADGRTNFDKPYAYTAGITAVGYTTDNTYAVNGSLRAADRATGHTRSRGRQVHGPEPTNAGLRVSLQSEYLFWRISEYHRKLITRPAGLDPKTDKPKRRVISRPAYDKAAGYVADIPTAIRRLVSIKKAIADPVDYTDNGWQLTDRPKYNPEQIDRMISDLKGIENSKHGDRFTAAQYTVGDLYGFTDLSRRIKAMMGKDINITKLGQWAYWNTRLIAEIKATDTPADGFKPTTDPPLQDNLTAHPIGPRRMAVKGRTLGDTPARVRRAKNGRITVDGRFAPAVGYSTGVSHGETRNMIDGFDMDRAVRRAMHTGQEIPGYIQDVATEDLSRKFV